MAEGNTFDNRTAMIFEMEKKLNPSWFSRYSKKDAYASISTAQYWDWITFIDVRYHNHCQLH